MNLKTLVKLALEEDAARNDVTTNALVPRDARASAVFVVKEDGIICGIDAAKEVFKSLDKKIVFKPFVKDGKKLKKYQKIASVAGSARALLSGERTALNILQHLSGIATLTGLYVRAVRGRTKIFDTRKTTPLSRELEKYAVKCGGGYNHRLNLSDMALIKDNHLIAADLRNFTSASLREKFGDLPVEIEAQNFRQVALLVKLSPDIIMLDNMDYGRMKRAIKYIRENSECEIEISGNVDLKTAARYASLRPDRISVGKITHSAPNLDISLEFRKTG
jgi:nicotinate-nucleotide pyrophosphorylase (carboxylating)